MAPRVQANAILRASLGALVPVVLVVALLAGRPAAPPRYVAEVPRPVASLSDAHRAARAPLVSARYDGADEWSAFVERAMASQNDAEVAYYVSQALEECHTLSAILAEDRKSVV